MMQEGKKDLRNRADIEILIKAFYAGAIKDPLIGHFFTEVVEMNWQEHIPIICDFWESVLFQTADYKGNAMKPHFSIHQKSPMRKEHFQRWLSLFYQAVDKRFEGDVAEMAKNRAKSIAALMEFKVGQMHGHS